MDSPNEILKSIEQYDNAHKQVVLKDYLDCLQTWLDSVKPVYDDLLKQMYESNERTTLGGQHIACIRRTTHDVNNEQLFLGHRELYDQLAKDGALTLAKSKAKLIADSAPECVVEKSVTYYTLKDEQP